MTRVVTVTGAGGVGKTTVSAALAIRHARTGARTLVVTVDPARRLGQTLGLEELDERDDGNSRDKGNRHRTARDLKLVGRGERNVADATTDVWAHRGFAYTGTFNSPCGGEPDGGVWVWNVRLTEKRGLGSKD